MVTVIVSFFCPRFCNVWHLPQHPDSLNDWPLTDSQFSLSPVHSWNACFQAFRTSISFTIPRSFSSLDFWKYWFRHLLIPEAFLKAFSSRESLFWRLRITCGVGYVCRVFLDAPYFPPRAIYNTDFTGVVCLLARLSVSWWRGPYLSLFALYQQPLTHNRSWSWSWS